MCKCRHATTCVFRAPMLTIACLQGNLCRCTSADKHHKTIHDLCLSTHADKACHLGSAPLCTSADKKQLAFCPRDQFHIPQPTPAYEELMRLLPAEYVGTSARLVPLVQLLCEEMGAAFEARAMTCPPWRQAKAMLSKWLPTKVGLLASIR